MGLYASFAREEASLQSRFPRIEYHIGLDLGKRQDFTALAIVEKFIPEPREQAEATDMIEGAKGLYRDMMLAMRRRKERLSVVYLNRLKGMDYRDQMKEVAARYHKIPAGPRTDGTPVVVNKVAVDITGVGDGVTALLDDEAVPHHDVWITSGTGESYDRGTRTHHVGRSHLINFALVAMEQNRLKASPRLRLYDTFKQELRGMRFEITPNQYIKYIHRENEHDDLVLAVSLACWSAERNRPRMRVMPKPQGL